MRSIWMSVLALLLSPLCSCGRSDFTLHGSVELSPLALWDTLERDTKTLDSLLISYAHGHNDPRLPQHAPITLEITKIADTEIAGIVTIRDTIRHFENKWSFHSSQYRPVGNFAGHLKPIGTRNDLNFNLMAIYIQKFGDTSSLSDGYLIRDMDSVNYENGIVRDKFYRLLFYYPF